MDTSLAVNPLNRDAWVRQRVSELPAGSRILDAGAGKQPFRDVCEHLQYVAQDFGQYNGEGDGVGLQTGQWSHEGLHLVCDIASVPEPPGSFDAILCTEVFEHIPHPIAAIQEFSRLLKPGGDLILTAPFCSLTHYSPYHYYTGFSRYFYETHLPQHGFDIVNIDLNGNYFQYLAQELKRLPAISRRYANHNPNAFERLALRLSLAILQRLSKRDKQSHELLCFGLHVHAVRNNNTDVFKASAS